MQIKDLPASTTLASTDVLAKDTSGGTTQKITAQNFAAAIKTLASLLGTSDVVNNLTSTSTTAPLSAAQGKALKDAIGIYTLESFTVAAGATITIAYKNSWKGFLVTTFASDVNAIGMWLVYQKNDAVRVAVIKSSSALTISQNSTTSSSIDLKSTYAASLVVNFARMY